MVSWSRCVRTNINSTRTTIIVSLLLIGLVPPASSTSSWTSSLPFHNDISGRFKLLYSSFAPLQGSSTRQRRKSPLPRSGSLVIKSSISFLSYLSIKASLSTTSFFCACNYQKEMSKICSNINEKKNIGPTWMFLTLLANNNVLVLSADVRFDSAYNAYTCVVGERRL